MDDDRKSFPFDTIGETPAEWDKVYMAQDFADYFADFIGNGVYANPSTGLKVTAAGGMNVTLNIGVAFGNGRRGAVIRNIDYTVPAADAILGRRDIVVMRLDPAIQRDFYPVYIQGTAASNPIVPPIVRTDDIFDLKVAEITVNANTTTISQANILDTRLDKNVCGIVTHVIDQVDTTGIFNQYLTALNEALAEWQRIQDEQETQWQDQTEQQQTEWDAWFARLGVDIQIYATFNFDNLAALKGTTYSWTPKINNVITETLEIEGSSTLVATRVSDFSRKDSDGIITSTETVYNANGEITRQASIPYDLRNRKAVIG